MLTFSSLGWEALSRALLHFFCRIVIDPGFPGGSAAKNLPAMQETHVRSQAREDSLEEEIATYSIILAWETQGQRRLVGYSPRDHRARLDLATETTRRRPSLILSKERDESPFDGRRSMC